MANDVSCEHNRLDNISKSSFSCYDSTCLVYTQHLQKTSFVAVLTRKIDFSCSGRKGDRRGTFFEAGCSLEKTRSETMAREFEVGDLVWGKVESHPWWPGRICDEAMASSSVRQTKSEGCLFVSFFGDNTYNWLHPKNLLPFECHFASKFNGSKSKAFQEAVQEAISEVYWREKLAFTCPCQNPSIGCEEGDLYPTGQVEKLRREIKPTELVSFLHKAALRPRSLPRDGHSLRNAATVLAYRKIIFAEEDPTYDEVFESVDEDHKWAYNDPRKALAQGATSSHSWLNKACNGSKRAKVEKAVDGPKVSRRKYGNALVFKNRYKYRQRNGGGAEIVDKETLIPKPFKPLAGFLPVEKALAKNVGDPPLQGSNNDKTLALPNGAGGRSAFLSAVVNQLEDCIENSQQIILPSVHSPPVSLNVYSRQKPSKFGNDMNKKHLESCQIATTTTTATLSSVADIARSIHELLKEIDKHLEGLK